MNLSDTESERRRFKRINLDTSVRYKFKHSNEFGSNLTRDISEGGLRLTVDKFVPINTDFIIELGLDKFSNLISAVGKVVWAKKLAHSENYQLGLEFQEMHDGYRKTITDYVKSRRI